MTNNDIENLPEPEVVPIELGGKWIAWSSDGLRIIAHGDTLGECEEAAKKAGEEEPYFQKTPRPDVRLIGATR